MNLLPMTYFIEVTKQRGISKAAESLQITQQTLSSHIAALEKELDCRLFVRRPKFRLTAEGELFLEYCEKFVGLDKSMREEFREMTGEIAGIVRVGISQTRSLILMPELITSFQKEYPRVKIYLSELANDELLSRIGDDELDIIIGDVSGERPDLETCELYREKMAVIIPKKPEYAPLAEALQETGDLRHLASWPMITNTRNDIVGRYISQVLLQNHIPPNIAAMSDIAGTCLRLCAEGVGVYLCPDLYIRYYRELEDKCITVPLPYSYAIHMAMRKTEKRAAAVERFAACLKEYKIT
ncbi:MAG: LysR family transcriptional regulator [Clostridium sp.]|nr:LysR family transcriptional regulator [Clostridium sp.]